MSRSQIAIALSAAVPAAVIVVDTYLLRPLDWGRGLAGGWRLLDPQLPLLTAGVAWVVLSAVCVSALVLVGRATSRWRIIRRASAAFSVVLWIGYPLAISFMQLAVEFTGVEPTESFSSATGALVRVFYLTALLTGPVVVISYVAEAVVKAVSGAKARGGSN